jgi:DNA-binding transcriptional LysR family regulator
MRAKVSWLTRRKAIFVISIFQVQYIFCPQKYNPWINPMDLRQLRYFVAVAEELHFGRAARRLAITQPPLSFNIARLEESLGFPLLRRTTREVALTPAGRVVYQEALKILALAREARELAERTARGEAGTVRVGIVGSALLTPLAARVRAFDAARPGAQVVVRELNSFEQIDAVQRRQIDIGIIHPRATPGGLACRLLASEPFICALPADHPLAGHKRVDLRRLRDENFVLFPRHFSPEYYDQIAALCLHAGFTPVIRHEARHMFSVASLVAHRFGVSLVPASLRAVTVPNLVFRPLTRAVAPSELHGIWREDESSPLVHALWASLAGEKPE